MNQNNPKALLSTIETGFHLLSACSKITLSLLLVIDEVRMLLQLCRLALLITSIRANHHFSPEEEVSLQNVEMIRL